MNYINHAILFFAATVAAQDYTSQYADQISSASSVISQDAQAIQATVSSYVQANGINSEIPASVKANVSERKDKRKGKKENAKASASAYFAEQGYSSMPPADVRQSYISSVKLAHSTQISDMRVSASDYMATQTNINTASLAAALSSYTATATSKPKRKGLGRHKMPKMHKAKKGDIQATSTATTTGMSNSFKNFFKSIQMKIQKTSVASVASDAQPAPTSAT